MDSDIRVCEQDELTAPLLADRQNDALDQVRNSSFYEPESSPIFVLLVALLAALAMASTSATAFYAHMTLICRDPQHCEGAETARYARLIATATCVANILGIFALGHLQNLVATNRKLVLLAWMLCRSMSALMLLVGVSIRSVYTALSGHLFEGLASDNLLHFTLNAIYAQTPHEGEASSLISYSLALYMIGISVSPFVVGLFRNFTVSFFIALGLFALSAAYIQTFVASARPLLFDSESLDPEVTTRVGDRNPTAHRVLALLKSWLSTTLSPLALFCNRPAYLLVGFTLFICNIVQSYIFTALLVHTSVRFGFTGRENGFVISLAHSMAASYIFISLYLIPLSMRCARGIRNSPRSRPSAVSAKKGLILSLMSISVQTVSLVELGYADQAWQVFLGVALLAIGLPTSSFIKGYVISLVEKDERTGVLSALAITETLGSVLGPAALGGLQSFLIASGNVFLIAAAMSAVALSCLIAGSIAYN